MLYAHDQMMMVPAEWEWMQRRWIDGACMRAGGVVVVMMMMAVDENTCFCASGAIVPCA